MIDGAEGISTSVVVRDATGQLFRFGGPLMAFGPDVQRIEIPLGETAFPDPRFAYPLDLLAVSVGLALPSGYELTQGSVAIGDVEASAAAGGDGGWARVPLLLDHGWRSTASIYGLPHEDVEALIDAVADGSADCVVSAGNTGALMAMAKIVLKTLPGIDRPAIAALFPTRRGESVMLDQVLALGKRPRLIRDLLVRRVEDDARPGDDAEPGGMLFDVPRRGARIREPDALEVGNALFGAWRVIRALGSLRRQRTRRRE